MCCTCIDCCWMRFELYRSKWMSYTEYHALLVAISEYIKVGSQGLDLELAVLRYIPFRIWAVMTSNMTGLDALVLCHKNSERHSPSSQYHGNRAPAPHPRPLSVQRSMRSGVWVPLAHVPGLRSKKCTSFHISDTSGCVRRCRRKFVEPPFCSIDRNKDHDTERFTSTIVRRQDANDDR